jgi:hypothetical protein
LKQPAAALEQAGLLLSGKKPYTTPDTTTFETACGCCFQAESRTLFPIQQPLEQPAAAAFRQKAVHYSRYNNL